MANEISPGRRLRLDRRKAGLSQSELAKQLGHTLEEISAMENNRLELTSSAREFIASIPARAPRQPKPKKEKPPRVDEQQDGPGPRVELPPGPEPEVPLGDRPPRAEQPRPKDAVVPRGEIAELEDALLKMFAGERLVVPKKTPDGVVQVQAVIPGIAQAVGMLDEYDGQIIEIYSPGMAKAWAELARVNPGVRRVLIGLTYGGAYRGVLAASLPPLIAIAAHHGWLPGFGVSSSGTVIEGQTEPEQEAPEWNGGVPPGTEFLFDSEVGRGPAA